MVSSITRKTIALAISLLVVVISLTDVALGAVAPAAPFAVSRYTPGFAGAPGKMARDAAGNFYVADFWGKGIVKLDRQGVKSGFIATNGRPSAVAVLPDNRLVVAVVAPQPKIAFYKQSGVSPNVSGEEDVVNTFGNPTVALYRPVDIAVDNAGKIYVLDSGDTSGDMDGFDQIIIPASIYRGNVKVYSAAGAFLHEFGNRTYPIQTSTLPYYFKLPQGIAHEKAANQIVVADTQNGRLQYFAASDGSSCAHVKSVGTTAGLANPTVGQAVKFANPVDVAFEYNDSTVLQRVYVAEKGKNQITVFDPANNFYLMGIDDVTVSGATMKQPSSILFERTGTGASTAGVVYTANAATSTAANVMALGIDGGTVPVPATLTIATTVPPTTTTSSLTLNGSVSLANNQVSCSVNGGTAVPVTAVGNSWSGVALTLVSGDNYILCKTTSGAVTTYAEANTYYTGVLSAAPTVTILQPVAGTITKNATVTVSGTSDTANATVQLVNSLNSYTVTTTTNAAKNWTAVVSLAEGSNLVTVSAWKQGTATGTADVTVTADFTAPGIAGISFLSNSATTNLAVQNIDGIIQEANLSKVEVNGVAVPATAMVTMTGNNTYFSAPVTLIRGGNAVTVTATDAAGNISTASTRTGVTLNPEIPGFTVALPGDNSYLAATGSVAASGAADNGFSSVNAYSVSGGTWSGTLSALAGFNEYQFVASGGGNVAVSAKRSINVAATNAKLAVTNPPADLAVLNSSVLVEGVVAPGFSPTPQISINGVASGAVTPDADYATSGKFSFTASSLVEGTNVIKVTAGSTTAVRNIIRDTALPDLTLQADSKAMPSSITGVIEPSAKISAITAELATAPVAIPLTAITFEAYDASTDTVTWHANLSGYTYDLISFTTVDPAGNAKTLPYDMGIPTGDIDQDGVVRLSDALAALRHVAGTQVLAGQGFKQADVGSLVHGRAGRDGVVDINDAVLILNKSYGLMTF